MLTTIGVLSAALAPAILTWWRGRKLIQRLDSPTLAEAWWEHRKRTGQWIVIASAVIALLAGWHTLWIAPLVVGLTLTAGFPARRALLGESWSVWAYLVWTLRIVVVFACPWALLILAPAIIDALGPHNLFAVAAVAVAIVIRLAMPQRWLIAILGAKPLGRDEHPELREFATTVADRSPAPAPQLLRLDLRGGRWINAVALVDPTRPSVAFSQSLLELTTPAEQCAIYAHELAHVEQFTPRRLRWIGAALWALGALSVALIPVASWLIGATWHVLTAWVVLMFALAVWRLARHQRHEQESDLRALELGAEPTAMITSLEKLHLAGKLPRRIATDEERRSSHPSLARRIQAIRAAAGTTETAEPSRPREPVVAAVRGEPGGYILLEAERITWLDNVPEHAVGDPSLMRANASATRSTPYAQLTELRVDVRRDRTPQLTVKDTHGRCTRTPLTDDETGTIQAALDGIDAQLASIEGPGLVGTFASATFFARLLGVLVAFGGLLLPGGGSVALLSLVAAVLPRAGWLLAAGICGLVAALLTWLRPDAAWLPSDDVGGLAAVVAGAAAVLILMAIAQVVTGQRQRERLTWLPPTLMLAWAGLLWTAGFAWAFVAGDTGIDLYHLHSWVRSSESLLLLPTAAAGTLLVLSTRWRWLLALLAGTLVVPAAWIGGLGFRATHVHDPFLSTTPPQPIEELALPSPLWSIEVPLHSTRWIRLGPDGERLAVGSATPVEGPSISLRPWTVHDSSGSVLAELEAHDVQLTGGSTVLALTPQAGATGMQLTDGSWSIELPPLEMPELTIDPASDRWVVTGTSDSGTGWKLQRMSGTVGSAEVTTITRSSDQPMPTGTWLGAMGVIVRRFPELEDGTARWWHPFLAGQQTHLDLITDTGTIELPPSHVMLSCASVPTETEALCAAIDDGQIHLWRITGVAPTRPQLLATVRAGFASLSHLSAHHAVLTDFTDAILVDRHTGVASSLSLERDEGFSQVVALTPTHLALLHRGESSTVSVHPLP